VIFSFVVFSNINSFSINDLRMRREFVGEPILYFELKF
jgi:hypothetical protein